MNGSARPAACARTALVIVDMQNDFVSSAGAMTRFGFSASDVQASVAPLAALLDAGGRNGGPVFHTRIVNDVRRNAPSCTAFWGEPAVMLPGSWGAEFIPELAPLPTETVVEKYGYGAFLGTSLDTALRACGVETITVAGTGPNICGGDSMHQAFALGYHVIAVSDCLACFSRRGSAHSATMKGVGLYVIEDHYGRAVGGGPMRTRLGTLRRKIEGALVFVFLGLLLVMATEHAYPDCCSTSDASFSSVPTLMVVGRLDFAPDCLLRGYGDRVVGTTNTRRWSRASVNSDRSS